MIEIYYVEDDQNIASIVKEYLERKNFKVTVCDTLVEARQALKIHVPTVVLLDWNMPDGHGDSLCQWIRSNWKEMPIIFLTVRGDSHDIVSGFQSGADDYVVKPFELEVLYSRILALLRRSGNVAEQYLSCDGIRIDQNRMTVSCDLKEMNLSTAEYQLLLYLMKNKGRTVTREKILEQIWDVNGSYVNNNTLTVTMKRLRDKLHQPSCLKTVRSVGYRMEDTI
ncbi:response regulator transcription factor [Blautia producta]|uniref:Stage 0 sporulation protein A homolog n=1 Tax=Blautia producta TaxID=33035 RepID=A0A4P6M2S1_9FIRM|nr:response regulator transcription factor [Blautia producta]QBE97743.1 Response regulator ArlR [Blautia producta]